MAALECEPDSYLTKPFNLSSLQQRLDRLIAMKSALQPALAECGYCLQQAAGMPAHDHRRERYRKLRERSEQLETAAGDSARL